MSDQIDQLATALSKAQGEMGVAYKNQKNPFFKSSYADFQAIVDASRPALCKYGLSVTQSLSVDDGNSILVSILMHSSGQWICSVARHNPSKSDIQSLSSYNTSLKRMCYASLVGVATSDDDDGNASVENNRCNNAEFVGDAELAYLSQFSPEYLQKVLAFNKVSSLNELTMQQFEQVKRSQKK